MGKRKLTNKEVDRRIVGKSIKRIGQYVGSDTPIEWKCLECNDVWKARPTKVLNENTGCPVCSYKDRNRGRRLTNEIIDSRLTDRPIIRMEEYKGQSHIPIQWKCTICSHVWRAMPTKILHQYTGCPHCADVGGGKFGRKVLRYGILFDSQLEADCFLIVREIYGEENIELQKKYLHNRRMRCDFFVPAKNMWIEVSTLKTKDYLNRIEQKQKEIHKIGDNFIFCNSPSKLKQLLIKY